MNARADLMIYEGKAKKIFEIPNQENQVLVSFTDNLTALNGVKKGNFDGKGSVNRDISSLLFRYLQSKGVESHWVSDQGDNMMVVRRVKIVPLEVVVRNRLAGSTAKKLGIEEGRTLKKPLVEFYYKNDDLGDPFLSESQVLMMEIVNEAQLKELEAKALTVNFYLKELFEHIGISLIDFKLEFGWEQLNSTGIKLLLADEISPDCMRLWDLKTGEKLDKDRFRRDLGGIREAYLDVKARLAKQLAK